MTAPPDEKIGVPPNAAVLSLFQMFFCEKNPAKNPIDRIGSALLFQEFSTDGSHCSQP